MPHPPATSTARLARLAFLLLAAALPAACAVPAGSAAPAPVPNADARRRDLLVSAELGAAPRGTALEAIRLLRPEYLRADQGARTSNGPTVVYVDGVRWGGIDALQTVPSYLVADVRRLRPVEARLRHGYQVDGSVLDVRLLRPARAGGLP